MRVIVTGGAGFIGSALVRALVADGITVLTVDALTYAGNTDNLAPVATAPNHKFIRADIADRGAIEAAIRGFRPDWILHLAAESHVDRSIDGPDPFITTNVVGTSRLLEAATAYWDGLDTAARDRFRFLQVSTDEVYGEAPPGGAFTEASPYRPSSPYAASKAAGDHLARAFHRTYGLPVLISNCGNNYGPYQFPEKLIPLMILNALDRRDLPIYGGGHQVRDWIHVDDHVAALRAVAVRGTVGETYLVGARSPLPNHGVVTAICAILDRIRPGQRHANLIHHVPDRPGHDLRYVIAPDKLERELGWQPQYEFHQGLEQTVDWYLENRPWVDRIASRFDRDRLGLAAGGRR